MIIRASKLENNDGLTIIELIIAITIISILAVLATSTYSNYATRAKIANQVSIVTAHAKDVYDLKKDAKNFYLEFPFSTVNEYGAVTKNIGENGENIISGSAEIMIRPKTIPPDSVKWQCFISGNNLSESSVPSSCAFGSSDFLNILKNNNIISADNNFDLENNPISNNNWGKIANGDPFLGGWSVSGGDEEIEIWNNLGEVPGERENVTELDGDSNEIVELSHDLASHNFENMTLTFDYYARTGDDSSNFEVYLGDELVYTHSDFSQQWQSISINLDNLSNAESQKLTIREAGNDDSYGALIDLDSLKVTPGEIV